MYKQKSTTKAIVTAILLLGIAVGGGSIWLVQSWKATRHAKLDAAYADLFPEPPEDGACYLRGGGHHYVMLVYQPDFGRVFFERTQD